MVTLGYGLVEEASFLAQFRKTMLNLSHSISSPVPLAYLANIYSNCVDYPVTQLQWISFMPGG